jgi:hypothetical protein
MKPDELQRWLVAHGQPVTVDGKPGPQTRAAIIAAFTNKTAPAVSASDIDALAARLGCSAKQVLAVSRVESGGAGFDDQGRPKILFERHLFHRITAGKHGIASFSNPKGGGYAEDSWRKLTEAACKDAAAAFSSASWGKFQVLGLHWKTLGYASPIEMAHSAVESEAAHYEMLARYIEHNGLKDEMRALSTNPETCRGFAAGYNGPGYRKFDYHTKLAVAMR